MSSKKINVYVQLKKESKNCVMLCVMIVSALPRPEIIQENIHLR